MRAWVLLLVSAIAASPVSAQQTSDAEDARRRAQFEQRKHDFDYLLGEWSFEAQHAEWGSGGGYWTAVRLPTGNGSHILDEYRVVDDAGETIYVSSTLRAYNIVSGLWELVSADEGGGLQDFGTARKVGDEMHIEQRFGVAYGQPELWRIRYHDIRPDAFSWTADRSLNDGATWQRNYLQIEARRIGPARLLEPLTRAPAKN